MTVSVQPESPTRKKSRAKSKYRRILRPLLDVAVAGMVFTIASCGLVCTNARAGIIPTAFRGIALTASIKPVAVNAVAEPGPLPLVQIATAASPAEAVYRQTSASAAWMLLGVAFSLMAALNLALVRHLKRTYAPVVRRFPLGK